jgi:crotonobetainyl-CoA:carnitine CoA-transferase CaiB-like acyl-CoA transferase
MVAGDRLLTPLRVLDLSGSEADSVTRILADLGADVLKVEVPGGSPARCAKPTVRGVSIPFALNNANKRATVLDPDDGPDRRRLIELAGDADIVVDSGAPGCLVAYGTSCAALADQFGHLVTLSVSDFGLTGPRSSWQATDAVLYALSGALSRSGPATGTPVLPPDGIASATAAVQATWAVLVAYYHRLRCGRGDYIDFSCFEAVVTSLDPTFGTQGQAALARAGAQQWRGRPRNQDPYPIFACTDGFVRICLLSPRQWHGLRAWLGEPEQFQDPKFDKIVARYTAWSEIGALLAALVADKAMDELVAAGQAHGVPIAAVLSASEVLTSEHFAVVGALTETELAPGVPATVPVGYLTVDGTHAGFRRPASALGHDEPEWVTPADPVTESAGGSNGLPFEGLRIVDLGVIVAGGELSRLFGDLGAEIIKVESAQFPDGLRQTREGQPISDSFAWAHRNNYGFGLEMRSPQGAEVFADLVGAADAVFANFKPGTLAALGFSYDRLRELNPALVLAESSAYGDSGPWSARMGYGPLVRATTGLTRLWSFYDATTIFPDHVVARITAIGALAALIHRDHTGVGARIHVSQAEAVVNQLDTTYVAQAAAAAYPGLVDLDTGLHAVYPCAGDDEWCVISLRNEQDRAAVAGLIGATELSRWTAARRPADVSAQLQAVGVPAGQMNRGPDVYADAQQAQPQLFTGMVHPLIDHLLPTETGPARYRHIPPAPLRPAPMPGEQTREIGQKLLGYSDDRTEQLITDGVLFTAEARTAEART